MSQSKVRAYKRMLKRQSKVYGQENYKEILFKHMDNLCREPFIVRWKFMWKVMRKINPHASKKVGPLEKEVVETPKYTDTNGKPMKLSEIPLGVMSEAAMKLSKKGIAPIVVNERSLFFGYKGSRGIYYPKSAWASGKSITDGRGLENLLEQLDVNN